MRTIRSDLRMDYTAVGQTTHLASRIEQLATPGSILISSSTARLAEGYPALENVADSIRSSPAAIQRELSRDNLNYKDLVEETRRDLALVYVRQRELAFSEIAFLLGYSELSAFSRAFHRWTGTSPRNYRTKETL